MRKMMLGSARQWHRQSSARHQHVFCVMTSRSTDMGGCCVDQLPLGLSIADGPFGFVYDADAMSEDLLAVRLLTALGQMNTQARPLRPTPPRAPNSRRSGSRSRDYASLRAQLDLAVTRRTERLRRSARAHVSAEVGARVRCGTPTPATTSWRE
jgi:hypothetical protein